MPIANCFLTRASEKSDAAAIVAAWSQRSGIDADEMTVNLVDVEQGGKAYEVMAWLYLPSLWSDADVAALGEGLAAALADVLHVDASAVQVLTSVVPPGRVVEAGETLHW
jgi:phenylpyruvate tautomerase PptA (4-oxalocrotonate tautomerase family)